MLKIRLQRAGRSRDPSFRLILTDSRKAPKSGSYLELLGSYDARKARLPDGQGKPQFKIERIKHWFSKGAQTSETARCLLVKEKII